MGPCLLNPLLVLLIGTTVTGCRAPAGDETEALPQVTAQPRSTPPGAVPPGSAVSPTDAPTDRIGTESAARSTIPSSNQDIRLEISLSERILFVYDNGTPLETHPVAVGQPEYPTPTGEYTIDRIIWNPEWVPPDSPWAEDEEYKAPGEEGNPVGRAQLVFDMPYTIHGTEDLGSLGQAASHGSVRVSNDVVIGLGRRLMAAGGASRPESWFDEVLGDPTDMREVTLPNPIPLRIYE